ncbi:MAG: toll/interleukin-1 receptor domain-containing protein [Armatimonadetes bacterium]|nr:toll/interleukin-1 receptor domain-containing protein [Armatimonadota bacterium]
MTIIRHKESGQVLLEVDAADLSGMGSEDTRFVGLNLAGADLRGTNLFYADFGGTNLEGADLSGAELGNASFKRSNLRGATLRDASVWGVSFEGCNLRATDLIGLSFRWCSFDEAAMDQASLNETAFCECWGLGSATGLETAAATGSTSLDRETISCSVATLPKEFLARCGYTAREIEVFREIYGSSFLSCFVSHAEADLPFAKRLVEDLRSHNVSCWHYKDRLLVGREWKQQIRTAIKSHDKLILVCSRNSLYRDNVVDEILAAVKEQRTSGEQKLFPIMLDDHILSEEFLEAAREKVVTKQWAENWVPDVRRVHILNFAGLVPESVEYQSALGALLASLRKIPQ